MVLGLSNKGEKMNDLFIVVSEGELLDSQIDSFNGSLRAEICKGNIVYEIKISTRANFYKSSLIASAVVDVNGRTYGEPKKFHIIHKTFLNGMKNSPIGEAAKLFGLIEEKAKEKDEVERKEFMSKVFS